jgi:hypothetical protein
MAKMPHPLQQPASVRLHYESTFSAAESGKAPQRSPYCFGEKWCPIPRSGAVPHDGGCSRCAASCTHEAPDNSLERIFARPSGQGCRSVGPITYIVDGLGPTTKSVANERAAHEYTVMACRPHEFQAIRLH